MKEKIDNDYQYLPIKRRKKFYKSFEQVRKKKRNKDQADD